MKKQLHIIAISLVSVLSVTSAYAGMIEAKNGDAVHVEFGTNQYGDGGEFLISGLGKNYNYIGFCVEQSEPIGVGEDYTLDINYGVADFAMRGGADSADTKNDNRDYLSNATKWLVNQYTNNYAYLYSNYNDASRDADYFAGLVQDAVWYFEDEIASANSLVDRLLNNIFSNSLADAKSYQADYLDSVKVLNIVTVKNNGTVAYRQSQVVAAPAPEPATMLLFGTGLAGLVGVMRSRRNKENKA